MSDPEWEQLLLLTSIPLREFDTAGQVMNAASGCLVEYRDQRLLLTVEHATRNGGRWAIELDYSPITGTQLHPIGPLQFVRECDLFGTDPPRTVDLAYAFVPSGLCPRFAVYQGRDLVRRLPRLVLRSDFSAIPRAGQRYGFSGHVQLGWVPGDPPELHADVQLETGLVLAGMEAGDDIYAVEHSFPGDERYKGCSGAPILSTDGDLVGLVLGRVTGQPLLRALPLRRYRAAIDALIEFTTPS